MVYRHSYDLYVKRFTANLYDTTDSTKTTWDGHSDAGLMHRQYNADPEQKKSGF